MIRELKEEEKRVTDNDGMGVNGCHNGLGPIWELSQTKSATWAWHGHAFLSESELGILPNPLVSVFRLTLRMPPY